ncbi:hypothetical protein ABIA35_006414 [Catenulispora sp. MAP12-49]
MPGFSRRTFVKTVGAGAAAALPAGKAPTKATASAVPAVLGETVNASGTWQVTASALGWTFSGSVGSPATGITTASGTDVQSAVIFTDTYVNAAASGTCRGRGSVRFSARLSAVGWWFLGALKSLQNPPADRTSAPNPTHTHVRGACFHSALRMSSTRSFASPNSMAEFSRKNSGFCTPA